MYLIKLIKITFQLLVIIVILISFNLTSNAAAWDTWDEMDEFLLGMFFIGSGIDFHQTLYIIGDESREEINPFMQDRRSVFLFYPTYVFSIYSISKKLESRWRKALLIFAASCAVSTSMRNAALGVGFSW